MSRASIRTRKWWPAYCCFIKITSVNHFSLSKCVKAIHTKKSMNEWGNSRFTRARIFAGCTISLANSTGFRVHSWVSRESLTAVNSLQTASTAARLEAPPTMTESSDLKASRRTILRAYALIIPSALASWWFWPASPQIALGAGLAVSAGLPSLA